MNANLDEKKKEEQAQAALAFGRKETFQEYLAKDPTYEKEVERERNRQKSWFSMFWREKLRTEPSVVPCQLIKHLFKPGKFLQRFL